MAQYFFYCPNCGYSTVTTGVLEGSKVNCRDGWGHMIFHSCCPQCRNLDAGEMRMFEGTVDEKEYIKDIISMYQNIRGFAEEEIKYVT